MTKICTSIEQSQNLIKLGIDITTADMYWSRCTITDFGDNTLKVSYAVEPCNISQFKYTKEDVPAWSLSALMELIPDIIEDYVLRIDKADGEYYVWYDKIGEGWSNDMAHPSSENFIDVAFEMIIWLKENKKI